MSRILLHRVPRNIFKPLLKTKREEVRKGRVSHGLRGELGGNIWKTIVGDVANFARYIVTATLVMIRLGRYIKDLRRALEPRVTLFPAPK